MNYGTQEREPMTEEAVSKQMKAAFRVSWTVQVRGLVDNGQPWLIL